MRIRMGEAANTDEPPFFCHDVCDFLIITQYMHTAKQRQMRHQYPIFTNSIRHFNPMLQMSKLVIFRPVTGGNVNKPCSLICRDVICQQYRHIMIISLCGQRMRCNAAFQLGAAELMQAACLRNAGCGADIIFKLVSDTDDITYLGK